MEMLFGLAGLVFLVSLTFMKKESTYDPSPEEKAGTLLFKLLKVLKKD